MPTITHQSSNESNDGMTQNTHTYTPQRNEEPSTKGKINSEETDNFKHENECLNMELNKQLKRLQQIIDILEGKKNKEEEDNTSSTQIDPESLSGVKCELGPTKDDEYATSWEVLKHHFSEVIRRHHDVLAGKDRHIRELEEKLKDKDITNSVFLSQNEGSTIHQNQNKKKLRDVLKQSAEVEDYKTGMPSTCDAGTLKNYQCLSQCNFTDSISVYEDEFAFSGEILSEHFIEVIRRHKQQLLEKDEQIRNLQEALKTCTNLQQRPERVDDLEVQMWHHEYYEHQQPRSESSPRHSREARDALLTKTKRYYKLHHDDPAPSEEKYSSTNTFGPMKKYQRFDSIANMEALRQYLMKRLEFEETLDNVYWQTELNRYQTLNEKKGYNTDPELDKDFEMLKNTRLKMLKALRDLRDSATKREQIYIKPIVAQQDEIVVAPKVHSRDIERNIEVQFTKQITISSVLFNNQP